MNLFKIDQLAQQALLERDDFHPGQNNPEVIELVRERIHELPVDCTPNWGIDGIGEVQNHKHSNWYRRDDITDYRYQKRIENIDFDALTGIVRSAVQDFSDNQAQLIGYGIYGSYLYREAYLPPEDLDILILVKSQTPLALDAMRYRSRLLKSIFLDGTLPIPTTDDIGVTMLSEDQFTGTNSSFIMTDAALLDVATTHSVGKQVKARKIPPFVLNHNGAKILRWGLSSVNEKPTSTLSRIDEALRMRSMIESDRPDIGLKPFSLDDHLPPPSDILRGIDESQIADIASVAIRLFQTDESMIREYEADRLIK